MQKTNKKLFHFIFLMFSFALLNSCFSYRKSESKNTSRARVESRKQGITIEANYDPRLDSLIPGYKIITIGLTNNGYDVLRLNPLKDKWSIVDAYGKTRQAIISVRISDPETFGKLPEKVRMLIDYPVGIQVGYSETFDIFFSNRLDLKEFRSITYFSAERNETYDILSDIGEPLNESTPQSVIQPAPASGAGKKSTKTPNTKP